MLKSAHPSSFSIPCNNKVIPLSGGPDGSIKSEELGDSSKPLCLSLHTESDLKLQMNFCPLRRVPFLLFRVGAYETVSVCQFINVVFRHCLF